MTSSVLVRLDGPMQSWGDKPRGAYRSSHTRPTKSGVIGLVANALGRDYTDPVDDLAAMHFAVRVDRAGHIEIDYHTTGSGTYPLLPGGVYADATLRKKARNRDPRDPDFGFIYAPPASVARDKTGELVAKPGNTNQTRDRYLADASFLVALTGDDTLTETVNTALTSPARAVFLGRKAYLPTQPLSAGLVTDIDSSDPFAALRTAPRSTRSDSGPLHAWADTVPGSAGSVVVHDQPISYAGTRQRGARAETHTTLTPPEPVTEVGYDFFQEAAP
ncbi:type I-E CRISPR-associated protein Cas5/CasD [Rhodococcus sp. WAY2]|uniref:type I-E CRISPR-associated protein Cas5/CasD n=1 Tax=Rhodococcus sp. WAY2 TaxID=2663121 RepID=UPI0013201079|nr:type I-E CRISPR-associated protein Cas5/CasD [Rhodococcus sp. WAY2]QHE72598.1 CRISPR-associated protein, Cas5e family [Rhodococcus sp. WAY2]